MKLQWQIAALGICLSGMGCVAAAQALVPAVAVDLAAMGLRGDAAPPVAAKNCLHAFLGYTAVRWLDDETVLLAFNLSPMCGASAAPPEGKGKLVTLDVKGKIQHSTEFSFNAGIANSAPAMVRDGVWAGPGGSVLINVPETPTGKERETRGEVLVFPHDLGAPQELATFTDGAHNKGFGFLGVTWDRSGALFYNQKPRTGEWSCLIYSGMPIAQTGRCDVAPWDKLDGYDVTGLLGLPKGYDAVYAGEAADKSRVAVFLQKKNDICMFSRMLCTWEGRLLVVDRKTQHRYFENKFPVNGSADLSPDGTHLATLQKGKLEIFSLQ